MPIFTEVCKWILVNLMLGGGGYPAMDWHPIKAGGGGDQNTPCRLMLRKPGYTLA